MKSAITFVCDTAGCMALLPLNGPSLPEAVAQARRAGWTVRYDGPGHGWMHWCPGHPKSFPAGDARFEGETA